MYDVAGDRQQDIDIRPTRGAVDELRTLMATIKFAWPTSF